MKASIVLLCMAIGLHCASALAHGDATHKARPKAISPDVHAWGQEGDSKHAVRTIRINMADTMRFSPATLTVRQGDTIKLIVRNTGKVLHELVLGTEDELRKHAALMKKHPDMEHDEPYMAHVKPGTIETIAWRFSTSGTFAFGCLVPGHWEAGMRGTIVVTPK
jgi:uncharacterized cupredoxin-like copper-binding protein